MATPVFIRLCEAILNDVLNIARHSVPNVSGAVSLAPVLDVTESPTVSVIPLSLTSNVWDRGAQVQTASVLVELTGYVGTSEIRAYAPYFEAVEDLLNSLPFLTYALDGAAFSPLSARLANSSAEAYVEGGDAGAYGFKSSISLELRRIVRRANA